MSEINKKRCKSGGFTLLELAISVVIIGLLMTGILSAYTVHVQKQQVDRTKSNIEAVNDAIASFVRRNGYYPCPAQPNDASAQSGVVGTQSDCSPGTMALGLDATTGMSRRNTGTGGQIVRVGVVPTTVIVNGQAQQLVSGDTAVDGWKNRLTYAVIEQMAVVGGNVRADGSITINPSGGGAALTSTARYIVLSHGPDGIGARTITGTLRRPCTNVSTDGENCNGDATFASIGISGIRSMTGDNNNFDDFVMGDGQRAEIRCEDNEELRGFNMHTREPICVGRDLSCAGNMAFIGISFNADGDIIPNCRNYTSSCGAGEVLVSTGDVVAGEPTTLRCVANVTGTCPAGHIQIGTSGYSATDGAATEINRRECAPIANKCPAGQVQIGVGDGIIGADRQPICVPSAGVCPSGQIQTGISGGGGADSRTPICQDIPSCPAGQYITGVSSGVLTCSAALQNNTCQTGEVVIGIQNGVVQCDDVPGGNATVPALVAAGPSCPSGWSQVAYTGGGGAAPLSSRSTVVSTVSAMGAYGSAVGGNSSGSISSAVGPSAVCSSSTAYKGFVEVFLPGGTNSYPDVNIAAPQQGPHCPAGTLHIGYKSAGSQTQTAWGSDENGHFPLYDPDIIAVCAVP